MLIMVLINATGDTDRTGNSSCRLCLSAEENQILLHFLALSKPTRVSCSFFLMLLAFISIYLNISSIYFILHEVRRRTHVNLLLSSQAFADALTNVLVMLPISMIILPNSSSRPNYYICIIISFLDHWFHSVTMLNLAAIIVDRYTVIVQRKLSAVTRRTEKSMAAITVIWLTTFVFDVSYAVPFLQQVDWISIEACPHCSPSKSIFQWLDEFINRIVPFFVILYCFSRMILLTYKSRHRVGVKNGIANWKTILIGIYAKSVNSCLVIMTLFLIGTFPDLILLITLNWRWAVDLNALMFATWMRFTMTVIKPGIYMMQSRKFSICWCSSCCRNVNVTTLVTLTKRPSTSVRQSSHREMVSKVSFTKASDLFSIKLQIDELDASKSNGSKTDVAKKVFQARRNIHHHSEITTRKKLIGTFVKDA